MKISEDAVDINCLKLPKYWPLSGWIEHVPFMFWLVAALKPRIYVELGTHTGMSHFAACQAVKDNDLETRCYAVDTWQGDEHAGFYSDEVFQEVSVYNKESYADFSTLLRMTFDEALGSISDKSVDLLHIDGRHFYDDVKHDFNSWLPKVSDRGVVLFHDTCVQERGFGVWKLWQELETQYPSFNFQHGHGLGVLAVGKDIDPNLAAFLETCASAPAAARVRDVFSACGANLSARYELQCLQRDNENLKGELERSTRTVAIQRKEIAHARNQPLQLAAILAKFHLYTFLSKLSPPFTAETAARLKRQADRCDPDRSFVTDQAKTDKI